MTGTLLVLILAQAASLRRKLARATWVDFLLVLFCFGAANSLPATLTPIKQARPVVFRPAHRSGGHLFPGAQPDH
jgi:hypothetical protein